MHIETMRHLLDRMQTSEIRQMELRLGDTRLRVSLPPSARLPAPSVASLESVAAPGFGRFYPRHPLQPKLGIDLGQQVAAGEVIGFLEVCGVITAVYSPCAGRVLELCAESGRWVQYAQTVIRLQTP